MDMFECNIDCTKDMSVIDPKHLPPYGDPGKVWGCREDCYPEQCKDIREGIYEFTGPKGIRSLCDSIVKCGVLNDGSFETRSPLKHSYPIYQVNANNPGCDKIVNAVWRDPNMQVVISCPGDYYIKYKWDACYEDEPTFEQFDICCNPCS